MFRSIHIVPSENVTNPARLAQAMTLVGMMLSEMYRGQVPSNDTPETAKWFRESIAGSVVNITISQKEYEENVVTEIKFQFVHEKQSHPHWPVLKVYMTGNSIWSDLNKNE